MNFSINRNELNFINKIELFFYKKCKINKDLMLENLLVS